MAIDEAEYARKKELMKSIVLKVRSDEAFTEEERLLIQAALVDHMIDAVEGEEGH